MGLLGITMALGGSTGFSVIYGPSDSMAVGHQCGLRWKTRLQAPALSPQLAWAMDLIRLGLQKGLGSRHVPPSAEARTRTTTCPQAGRIGHLDNCYSEKLTVVAQTTGIPTAGVTLAMDVSTDPGCNRATMFYSLLIA